MVLKDGYFEVEGKAYCEKDAWKRVQQHLMPPVPRNGSSLAVNGPGLPSGPRRGGPGSLLGGKAGQRLKMEKRRTRFGMI
jgi:hypothetical protein